MSQTENLSSRTFYVIENHPQDSRAKICEDDTFQTLSSRMGTGGNNVPMVVEDHVNERIRSKVLCILQETYGTENTIQWSLDITRTVQETEILRPGMYEESIQSEAKDGYELDDSTLPCPKLVANWLLRDMWEQQKCGCSSQGWKPAKQQLGQSSTVMSKLSYKSPSSAKEMFDMWSKGKGLWLLRQALSEVQEIWKSSDGSGEGGDGMNDVSNSVVRRLTPL